MKKIDIEKKCRHKSTVSHWPRTATGTHNGFVRGLAASRRPRSQVRLTMTIAGTHSGHTRCHVALQKPWEASQLRPVGARAEVGARAKVGVIPANEQNYKLRPCQSIQFDILNTATMSPFSVSSFSSFNLQFTTSIMHQNIKMIPKQ